MNKMRQMCFIPFSTCPMTLLWLRYAIDAATNADEELNCMKPLLWECDLNLVCPQLLSVESDPPQTVNPSSLAGLIMQSKHQA